MDEPTGNIDSKAATEILILIKNINEEKSVTVIMARAASILKRLYPKQPLIGVGAVLACSDKILLEKRKNEPGRRRSARAGAFLAVS